MRATLFVASIALFGCRAGAREGLGPTGVPLATAGAPAAQGAIPDSATGPASAPLTVWKAEYYQISDG